jgi:hypothetical protein
MYELELALKKNIAQLNQIKFHADEANVDRQLKEFLKAFIINGNNVIPKEKMNYKLTMRVENETEYNETDLLYKDYSDLSIQQVLLPDELTAAIKTFIAESKSSVYTNPDLLFKITNGTSSSFVSVELKSTKTDAIPGSSIQQVNPHEWVIFVKHNDQGTSISTGQYINSINSKLQFPDRSPRPQVSFKELTGWNDVNRIQNGTNTKITINRADSSDKLHLLLNWQSFLAYRWIDVLFAKPKKVKEPWFNNALRIFASMLINRYDKLDQQSKLEFTKHIENSIIKGDSE